MNFELTVLGSASALPTSIRFPTAQVLCVHERFFLIDCGEGTQLQLRKYKIGFSRINAIFLSHLHGDHVFGLYGLLSTFHLLGRKNLLHIYGPVGLLEFISFFRKKFSPDLSYEIMVHEIFKKELSQIYEDKSVEVFAFPLKHRIACFGYLFKEKKKSPNIRKEKITEYNLSLKEILAIKDGGDLNLGSKGIIPNTELVCESPKPRSYAFCSDTAYYKKITSYLKNVDLLYHEATFLHSDKALALKTGHSTAKQAAKIALESSANKLLIGHFSARYKDVRLLLDEARQIFPNTELADDGLRFKVEVKQ